MNPNRRAVWFRLSLVGTFLALAIGLGMWLLRSSRGLELTPAQVSTAELAALLADARGRLTRDHEHGGDAPFRLSLDRGLRVVFLSLSRPAAPAWVGEGRGRTLLAALDAAVHDLAGRASPEEITGGRLHLDVLSEIAPPAAFDGRGRAPLEPGLDGLYFPAEDLFLLPGEITAQRLMDGQGDLQRKRLGAYLTAATSARQAPAENIGAAGRPFVRVRFASVAELAPAGAPQALVRGNVLTPATTPDALLAAARAGGDYLVQHLDAEGRFGYSYRAWADSYDDSYNLLRHAGTCYALFELARATGDRKYLEAGRRGMTHLLENLRPGRPEDQAAGFLTVAPANEEAKLGGAALAMLAILEHRRVSGEDRWMAEAEKLARFLVFLQEPSGRFESKYWFDPAEAEPFESIYYPGEAILALARYHRATGNPRWLDASRRGANWLIDVRDQGKATADLPHDHWLLMGLGELHPLTGDDKFLRHGERIAEAILGAEIRAAAPPDWLGGFYDPPRATPTATRGEALVAMYRLAATNGRDATPYREAMERFAAFQLRCQFGPTNTLYLPRPDRALGGIRRDLTHGEVRIDYVQHTTSALLGLREIQLGGG